MQKAHEKLHPFLLWFSKVSALVCLLYKATRWSAFQKAHEEEDTCQVI